jgi:hypothetical protein
VVSILEENPIFYALNMAFGSYFFRVCSAIFDAFFSAYAHIYVVVIFDCLSFDRLVGKYFGLYLLFFGVHCILSLFHELNDRIVLMDYDTDYVTNYSTFFAVERWADWVYYCWAIFTIVRAMASSRLKRGWRLPTYLLMLGCYLFWSRMEVLLKASHVFLEESPLVDVITRVWVAGIPLMCMFFFWPSQIAKPEAQPLPISHTETLYSVRKGVYSCPNLRNI